MKTTYDKLAGALYITLRKGTVCRTAQLSDRMNADMDKAGNLLGIEVLNASQQLNTKDLSKQNSIPLAVLDQNAF